MSDEPRVDEKLLEAFHLMFDHYPKPAQLAHKSKKIVAVNPAGEAIGRQVGMVCATHGAPEAHRGCLAARAVKNRQATWQTVPPSAPDGREVVVFWLPVTGHPDFFVHFSAGNLPDQAESESA